MPYPESWPPVTLSRRSLMIGTAVGVTLATAGPAPAQQAPELTVTEALRNRKSTRAFADRAVDPGLLAELLWAAFGINRLDSGLHTAPSWRGAADTVVHVATADGVMAYDPAGNTTTQRHAADIRALLSTQPFVATAPICLIHISDLRRLDAAEQDDQKAVYAQIDAAIVAQNVYVFAAARGLGTCLVGGADRQRIADALTLAEHEFVAFVQPVGWPAES